MASKLSPQQKQIFAGVIIGVIMGVVISWLTGFWLWLPAGVAVGLASGTIIKPPTG